MIQNGETKKYEEEPSARNKINNISSNLLIHVGLGIIAKEVSILK